MEVKTRTLQDILIVETLVQVRNTVHLGFPEMRQRGSPEAGTGSTSTERKQKERDNNEETRGTITRQNREYEQFIDAL